MYLVADGGGTKTDFLLFDESGRVLATAREKGSNATFTGAEAAAQTVAAGISACLAAAGARPAQLGAAVLFIPGFAPALPLLRAQTGIEGIGLMDDIWNAFYGALGGGVGIVALTGTGSFVVGRGADGKELWVGGWGPLFGDFGSGHHLGVLCLRAVARLYDEGRTGTPLETMLLAHMGIQTVEDLRTAAYAPGFGREQVAGLSFIVQRAAEAGDETAAALFDDLAAALVDEVALMAARLAMNDAPLSVTGGMVRAGRWFTDAFCRAARRRLPGLHYTPAKYSPLVGAALYLLQRQGANLADETIARRLAAGANTGNG